MKDICKPSDCSFVYPVADGDSVGNSLSSINFNFRQVDIQLCNIETDVNYKWMPTFTAFAENSGNWLSAINTFQENSACWQQTRTAVNQMSSFWLKPITLVYPYPFTSNIDIATIRNWLLLNFPVRAGNCFNYIYTQEMYIFCPQYFTIDRQVSSTQSIAKTTAKFTYTCSCIGKGSYSRTATKSVDCGNATLSVNVPDQYISSFVGIKFQVTSNLEWDSGTKIFG